MIRIQNITYISRFFAEEIV